MAALKNPVALDVMRRLKAVLDPGLRMNPGKVLPAG
jgi:FAD/FMN-containing dehydrogenase